MEHIIRKILKEVMLSNIDNSLQNCVDYGGVFGTPISIDTDNGDMLYLFVGFTSRGVISDFSYSFQLFDKVGTPKTDLLVKRDEVNEILPKEMVGKRMIMPIIYELTRKLLRTYKPKFVFRETSEILNEYSLMRYNEITKIFLNEFMYRLVKKGKDQNGYDFWVLELVDKTKQIDEGVEYIDIPTREERVNMWEKKIRDILPNIKSDIIKFNKNK